MILKKLYLFLILLLFLTPVTVFGAAGHSFGPALPVENWDPMIVIGIAVGLILILSLSTILLDKSIVTVANYTGNAVGIVLLAFASSLPLLVIAITQALSGNPQLALTTIIVTNIANVTLVLGTLAFISPLRIEKNYMIGIAATVVTISVILLMFIEFTSSTDFSMTVNPTQGSLGSLEGLLILGLFAIFVIIVHFLSNSHHAISKNKSLTDAILLAVGFGILVSWSANQLVIVSIHLAQIYNLPEIIVGTVLVVVGTSLPEFSVGFVAMGKGESEKVFTNLITSSMVNLCIALGVILLFQSFIVDIPNMSYNLIALIIVTILAVHYLHPKYQELTRWHGIILVGVYVLYLVGLSFGIQISF